jgi:hypothetical protein
MSIPGGNCRSSQFWNEVYVICVTGRQVQGARHVLIMIDLIHFVV